MPEYPPLNSPIPPIYTQDHVRDWEQALQQLAITNEVIKKCERCRIPVEASRQECDSLCEFFRHMIAEERGQQASMPAPM